jgi:hypothetical protein
MQLHVFKFHQCYTATIVDSLILFLMQWVQGIRGFCVTGLKIVVKNMESEELEDILVLDQMKESNVWKTQEKELEK